MRLVTKQKLYLTAAVLLLLVIFNVSRWPHKSEMQGAYEEWLRPFEQELVRPPEQRQWETPIRIRLSAPKLELSLEYDPRNGAHNAHEVARVLEMAREANLFSHSSPLSTGSAPVVFAIEGAKQAFEARLSHADIEENIKAQAMLRLFSIYAGRSNTTIASNELGKTGITK